MTGVHEPLDVYARRDPTWLHRTDARLKLLAALALVTLFGATPATFWPAPAGVSLSLVHIFGGVLLAVLIVVVGLPIGYLMNRLLAVAPVLLAVAISVPLARGFDSVGWSQMLQVLVRSGLSFLVVLLLANTTPFDQLLRALGQFGVPRLFLATLGFMARYHTLFGDELARMRRARLARTFDSRGNERWYTVAVLIGRVLVRALDRSQRVHAAMLARGYDGSVRTLDDC
jgi:cobalt/nickel transport system permease protein